MLISQPFIMHQFYLRQTRDLLLPRLVSGDLGVDELEIV